MNEQLIKFIELCLSDGIISEKERVVIFRKSKELGVPEDECEIILEGMIIKFKSSKVDSNTKTNIDTTLNEEIIKTNEFEHKETSDDKLRSIFDLNFKEIIQGKEIEIDEIKLKIEKFPVDIKLVDKQISENDNQFNFLRQVLQQERQVLQQETKFDFLGFQNQIEKLILDSLNLENDLWKSQDKNLSVTKKKEIILKKLNKNIFGKRRPGEPIKLPIIEFIKKGDFESSYYISEKELEILKRINKIHSDFKKKIKPESKKLNPKLEEYKTLLIENDTELNSLKKKRKSFGKLYDEMSNEERVVKTEIERIKKIISDKNFHLFKKLYNNSPILFQSNIFSKYLEVIDVKNDKEIMNLTRFVNLIIDKEKEYSKEISKLFDKLNKGDLNDSDLNILLINKRNLIVFYNCFHVMYQSLITSKMGLYMKIYIELESMGIFNTFFEENVLVHLNTMNLHLEKLNTTLLNVSRGISKTNDYLGLLNKNMYQLNLSVDETNYNLQDISSSINNGNDLLRGSNDLLDSINSGVGLNNLLTGIQTYQMYKVNKNTKSLRG